MEFGWTPAQTELYEQAFRFAKHRLNHLAPERERTHSFNEEAWRRCGEFGLHGLCVPPTYGGMGLDSVTTARVIEAFGRGSQDMGLIFSSAAHLFACSMPILDSGSEELKRSLLPKLASGEWIGANAITEAEAGSDAFALKARAVRSGDHFVLNGTKIYVTNAPVADVFLVYASTNPKHGYLGITAFVVTRDSPGLSVGEPFRKVGLTTSPMSSVYLNDCRIPVQNQLGGEGQGAHVFQRSMHWERTCLFAAYLGLMERQLESTIAYAKERRQFGKPLAAQQAVSHRIVDMKLRLDAARLLLYRGCWLRDEGNDASLEIALAKVAVSEAAVQSGLDAVQIHGGNGIVEDLGVVRALRDALPSTVFSGTSEIQRNLVARGLGL